MNKTILHTTDPELVKQQIWKILEEVNDPEVPVLSVIDLGIVRDVAVDQQVTPMFGMWATLKGLIAMIIGGLGSILGIQLSQ